MAIDGQPAPASDRAETRERLRALIRRLEARPTARPEAERFPAAPVASRYRSTPEAVFPRSIRRETDAGRCLVIEEPYPLDYRVGEQPLADVAYLSPRVLSLLAPGEGIDNAQVRDLLFLDIETTRLGGAGALAFLVAAGRVEAVPGGEAFVLRQYLATSPPEEAAVLAALIEDAGVRERDPVLVTYNGRTFDAPMLDERATMHRMRAGFDALRHLDLLAPIRTGLRGALASCRLATVESDLLSLTRPSTEVGGAEVPAWYFRFLRSGDARLLAPLVEHSAIDVLSLGALLGRFSALLESAVSPGPLDALALGRLHAARGEPGAAIEYLERATAALEGAAARDDALLRLAALYKMTGRRTLAAPLWRELATTGRGRTIAPLVEIAKHLEHDLRDYRGGIEVVDEALAATARLARFDRTGATRWRESLMWRRARLERRAERVLRQA